MSDIQSIGIIGTGKAARFFSDLFKSAGIKIQFVYGRRSDKAMQLAAEFDSEPLESLENLPYCDMIFLAVNDDAIAGICSKISRKDILIVHCAGSVNINVFKGFEHFGVVYPLQSLTPGLNPKDVPLLIEASSDRVANSLSSLMSGLEVTYRMADSETRLKYHLAAVFANNFTNAVLNATYKLGIAYNLEFDLLKPLITATFSKVINGADPASNQTGPALRGDESTMRKHLNMLNDYPDLQLLYKQISDYIRKDNYQNPD